MYQVSVSAISYLKSIGIGSAGENWYRCITRRMYEDFIACTTMHISAQYSLHKIANQSLPFSKVIFKFECYAYS